MKYAFIGGIPAAGKTYLAKKVSEMLGTAHFPTDNWRNDLRDDPALKKWVDFFWNLDEKKYYEETDCEGQWKNLRNQSEAFWPKFLKKIKDSQASGQPAIFEGVNILPHLARRDLDFSGIFLLGKSYETILERNKKQPRWGKTATLQEIEAKAFWNCERVRYKEEAERYNFKTFSDPALAEKELLKILSG